MPLEDQEVAQQPDLRAYLQILKRRGAVVALTTLVVVAVALAYSLLAPPKYSASATVLVPLQPASAALDPTASQAAPIEVAQRTLADDLQFAQGDAVKQSADKILGFKAKPDITSSTTADVLTFTGSSGNKADAARIANVYAKAYIDQQRANQVAQYTQQVTALQSSISQLQAKASKLPANSPELAGLQQSISSLTQSVQQLQASSQLVAPSGASTLTQAIIPKSPVSPKPIRNGLLGLLVGLILGVGLAFLIDRMDDRIRSRQDVEAASGGLPIVGMIPMVDAWRKQEKAHLALVEDSSSAVSEAYRTLRTAVQFLSIDDPKKVIGLTSSLPGEGKTTTVANLAVSLSRAGHRVVVVSCDLRKPHLHDFFGLGNGVGLTSVLLGESSLQAALSDVPDEPWLRVLPSGPIPPNPAEILSLDRVREVVDALAEAADAVLIDCPPVLPVTDALLLSRLTDGMLVLASATNTSKRDLARTCELLEQVQAPVLGTVLTRVPAGAEYEYGYGYGGYYAESRPAEVGARNGKRGDATAAEGRRDLVDRVIAAEAVRPHGTPMLSGRRQGRAASGQESWRGEARRAGGAGGAEYR